MHSKAGTIPQTMPDLAPPSIACHRSFLEAVQEFRAEGRLIDVDPLLLAGPDGFRRYVEHLRAEALPETPRPAGWVPATNLWYVEGGEFLGRLSIRHRLTESLRRVGGHIGYEVRPSARRRGHATDMLRRALPVARDLGIDPALVTCDAVNVASRRVIEHNGGRLAEEEHGGKLRFWVPTS